MKYKKETKRINGMSYLSLKNMYSIFLISFFYFLFNFVTKNAPDRSGAFRRVVGERKGA